MSTYSSTKDFQRLPLAIRRTRELLVWIYSLSGKICKRAVPGAVWGLQGNAFLRQEGRRTRVCMALLAWGSTQSWIQTRGSPLCFPSAQQLEKLLGSGGKGSELRACVAPAEALAQPYMGKDAFLVNFTGTLCPELHSSCGCVSTGTFLFQMVLALCHIFADLFI